MFIFTKSTFTTDFATSSFSTDVVYSDQNELVYKALLAEGWEFVGCADEADAKYLASSINATSCRKVDVKVSFTFED